MERRYHRHETDHVIRNCSAQFQDTLLLCLYVKNRRTQADTRTRTQQADTSRRARAHNRRTQADTRTRTQQTDTSRHTHAHTQTHERNSVPDTGCATTAAEKIHGPNRHTCGFTINKPLKEQCWAAWCLI